MYPWTRKSPLNFVSHADLESGSGFELWMQTPGPHTPDADFELSAVSALFAILNHVNL